MEERNAGKILQPHPKHPINSPSERGDAALLCSNLLEQEAEQDGWTLRAHVGRANHGKDGHTLVWWTDETRRGGINRPQNLLLGPALISPTAAEAALIHVLSPDFALLKGPLRYLNLMVSMAFAQCFLMVPCEESGC